MVSLPDPPPLDHAPRRCSGRAYSIIADHFRVGRQRIAQRVDACVHTRAPRTPKISAHFFGAPGHPHVRSPAATRQSARE